MKRIVCLICAVCIYFSVIAQPVMIPVATDKTTSLIFPFPILHVDRGAKDVLVQKLKEADHILLLKAATADFPETNVTVVTNDGSVYSFLITYTAQLQVPVYYLPEQKQSNVATYANGLLDNPPTMRGVRGKKFEMGLRVHGLYIKDDVLYVQLRLSNESSIDYDIDLLTFSIRDKKKGRRTAVQEQALKPMHISGNATLVKARSFSTLVVALEKFTIPDAKVFIVQLMEKKGGRHLQLKLKNRHLIQSIILPALR